MQALRETWCHIVTAVVLRVAQPQGIWFIIFICYSHKICYIMIWYVLSKFLYIYTYGDTGIMEIDSVTGSIYSGDPGVDRHHHIKRNLHSIFPSSWSHTLLPSFHRSTQFVVPHALLLSVYTSAKCNYITRSFWECLRIVRPESQRGQMAELTGPTQWPSGAPRSTWEHGRQAWECWRQAWEHLESL